MPIIQESENRQEDCGLELIKAIRVEEYGICTTRGNSKPLQLKLSIIDMLCDDPVCICVFI